ncbi:MAG: aminotransferase class V-fold PLP-dependent enzyme, partial [Bacteroidota bacterium]
KMAVARLVGAHSPGEIALVESASIAWYKAFEALEFKPGEVILTSMAEYGTNFLGYLRAKKRYGIEIQVVPDNEFGEIDLAKLEEMIHEKVKLISLTHIPTNGGLVNPAAEVGQIARAHGITYLLDACQTAGQMPIDVEEIGCDFLAATGRKFMRAPRGTGFLYARTSAMQDLDPPFTDLMGAEWESEFTYKVREDAQRFENFENNRAARVGLGIATDYALQIGPERIWDRVQGLASLMRKQLSAIPGVTVTDKGRIQCGIVTFVVESQIAEEIRAYLSSLGINVSVSADWSTRLDMADRNLTAVVRASVHYYNTKEEINRLCEAVENIS